MKIDPDLYSRLKRYRARRAEAGAGAGPAEKSILMPGNSRQEQTLAAVLAGLEWRQASEYVYTYSFSLPNPYREQGLTPLFGPAGSPGAKLCFYDTETTGLSGGAGTIVFLLGLGWIDEKSITIEQFFVADFPGERDFLTLLSAKLAEDQVYVSYNGSAFDRHILQTRYVMHGLEKQLPNQLDLLYPVRRLWKSIIGACSLSRIEEEILHISRGQDVPGWEIPALYFQFLRTGDPGLLTKVFSHNRQDVLSLVHLYFKLQNIFSAPEQAREVDRLALGNLLLEQEHPAARILLADAFGSGDTRCGMVLSMSYKREGKWQEAVDLWQELYTRSGNLAAALELAKYWEHKKRQSSRALALVEEVLASGQSLDGETRRALLHRLKRLQHKTKK